MRSAQGSRSTQYRYFVLPGDELEVARVNGHGAASFWAPVTHDWISDPLLAVEIVHYDEWRPTAPEDLPAGVERPAPRERTSRRRRRRRSRKGRHSDPAT
ncbi:MAG: hypothetical protein JWR27_1356 [Aeromicrobium sp.]|nr:hypothetical protein [Aeromicrobium sp.]